MNSKQEAMRLGRRAAYLRRCVKAAELMSLHENDTSIRYRVFKLRIQPVLGCSYATFNNMLNEPNPLKQLEDIENRMLEIKKI